MIKISLLQNIWVRKSKTFWIKLAALICILVWFLVFSFPSRNFEIWFFDVGQGDAIFIKTPGNRQILIDGGPDASVLRGLSEVMPFWDRQIDLVFITHLHADHIGGVIEVLKRYKVEKLFINPSNYQSPFVTELNQQIEKSQLRVNSFMQGDRVEIGGLVMTSFWPVFEDETRNLEDINTTATVLDLKYQDFKVLLTSDVELGTDAPVSVLNQLEEVDLLKVPHQGNKNSLNQEVLDKMKPAVAIIPVGKNSFGHPAEEIIKLLEKNRIEVYRTDKQGNIQVIIAEGRNSEVITKGIKR